MFWHECDEQRKLARERKQERSQKKACPSSQIATTTTTKEAGAIKPVSKSRTHLFFPPFFSLLQDNAAANAVTDTSRRVRDKSETRGGRTCLGRRRLDGPGPQRK